MTANDVMLYNINTCIAMHSNTNSAKKNQSICATVLVTTLKIFNLIDPNFSTMPDTY